MAVPAAAADPTLAWQPTTIMHSLHALHSTANHSAGTHPSLHPPLPLPCPPHPACIASTHLSACLVLPTHLPCLLLLLPPACIACIACMLPAGIIKNTRAVSACMHRFCKECIEAWLRTQM